jgi:subtilisin family serine protease
VLIFVLHAALPAAAGPRASRGLRERAAREGSVRVIVQVEALGAPEASLDGPTARQERRRRISRAQDGLLDELSRQRIRHIRRFRRVPFVAMEVGRRGLRALERSNVALAIEEDRLARPLLPESVPLVGGDAMALDGFDGSGRAVAVLDTGVDSSHAFLAGRTVAEGCFSANGSCPDDSTEQIGAGAGVHCDYESGCFHGTHVAGIVLGSNASFSGVAPGASLIALQVFSEFSGEICDGSSPCALSWSSDQIAALEHVLDLSETLTIDAVNLSLGGGEYSSQAECDLSNAARKAAIENLRAAGIATVVSSGNSGYVGAVSAPACITGVVSVGASDDLDVVASFSNHAAFLSLLAPGVGIASAVPFDLLGFSYGVASGTSMAAPHVAGAWAALRQAAPEASVSEVLSALQATGVPVTGPGGFVVPRIELASALDLLEPVCSGPDSDADGVPDSCDNCTLLPNPDQADVNEDGYGNLCDPDFNDDGMVSLVDFNFIRSQFGLGCGDPGFDPVVDMSSDCLVGIDDFNRLKSYFAGPPGPSGVAPVE